MSTSTESIAQVDKKTVSGVTFTGTATGKLTESEISSDSYKSHYLVPADTKSDSSFPVVDADGDLRKGNVSSAWDLRGHAPESANLESKLKKLAQEFDSSPLPDDVSESARFERAVDIVEKDESEHIAYGAVLVPNELDHQLDYFRGETIRELAENYHERFEDGDVYAGVMHSVFPEDVTLAEDRVLDEPETLGDHDFPADTWIQGYRFEDPELWSLVESGTLGGYSIGGTAKGRLTDPIPDDVRVPDDVAAGVPDDVDPRDLPGRELVEGRIFEVSSVDFPAVARATHEEYKSQGMGTEKGHPALTGTVVEARLYLESRGHDPDDARQLAEYLQSEKATEPDGWLARAKQFFTRDGVGDEDEESHEMSDGDSDTTEKGQTLSEENLTRGMALHDISLDLLGTEIDHGRQKFATDSSVDFAGVAYVQPEETDSDGSVAFSATDPVPDTPSETPQDSDAQPVAEAAEPARTSFEDMTDEETHELIERIETLEAKYESDESDTVQTSPDESGTEPTDKDRDSHESDDTSAADDAVNETLERVADTQSALESQIEQQAETQQRMLDVLERMASAQGVSQQADVSGGVEEKTWDHSPFAVGGGD